ncbi:MAG: serine/threonine-protein phosphatase [Deltaproteobacteria bacterium]|nr:serine/threonine-protein phosphatase [Deltaproteobacteria bacterium]
MFKKIRFRTLISLITLSGVTITAIGINFVSFGTLYQEKLKDTWAIMFLEMERKSTFLRNQIRGKSFYHQKKMNSEDFRKYLDKDYLKENNIRLLIEQLKVKNRIQNKIISNPMLISENHLLFKNLHKITATSSVFYMINNDVLMGSLAQIPKGEKKYFIFSRIDLNQWIQNLSADKSQSLVYLMNDHADLLYTNKIWLSPDEARSRPTVQKFVSSPLGQSLSGYKGSDDIFFYGFYYQIPDTNLAIFSELDFQTAITPVKKVVFRSIAICIAMIALIILVIQIPLNRAIAPLKRLTRLTDEVSRGIFNVSFISSGVWEFRYLGESFLNMCRSLDLKDQAIKKYIAEIEDKVRMERELEIARQVQNNLLIKMDIPDISGLDLATHYTPASEVAGDWYGSFYDEKEGCSIIAIADVSGHGAGSSMFTAIIASAFDKFFESEDKYARLPDMLRDLNSRIYRLGKSDLHATMIVVYAKDHHITWYNAGHNFPLLLSSEPSGVRSLPLPSVPLGIEKDFKVCSRSFPLEAGQSLFLYTDGLIENKNRKGKMFGKTRMLRFFKSIQSDDTAQSVLMKLRKTQEAFSGSVPPDDDTCLLFLKRIG